MKRLLLTLFLTLATATTFGLSNRTVTITNNIDDMTGNWDDFFVNVSGFDTWDWSFFFTNNAGWVNVASDSFGFRASREGTIFIDIPNASITKSGSNITFTVARTNIPPVNSYNCEVLSWQGATTNTARTMAKGQMSVHHSLYEDTNSFPFPSTSITSLTDYLTITGAVATYQTIANSYTNFVMNESTSNAVSFTAPTLNIYVNTNVQAGDITAIIVTGGYLTAEGTVGGTSTTGNATLGLSTSAIDAVFATDAALAAATNVVTTNLEAQIVTATSTLDTAIQADITSATNSNYQNVTNFVDSNYMALDGTTLPTAAWNMNTNITTNFQMVGSSYFEGRTNSTLANPAYHFDGFTNTGMGHAGTNQIRFGVAGVEALRITEQGLQALDADTNQPAYSFRADVDTGFMRVGADRVGFVAGTELAAVMDETGIDMRSNTLSNGVVNATSYQINGTNGATGTAPDGTVFANGLMTTIGSLNRTNSFTDIIVADPSVLAGELLINGDFNTNAANWALTNAALGAGTFSNWVQISAGTTGTITYTSTLTVVEGYVYRLTYDFNNVGAQTATNTVTLGSYTTVVTHAATESEAFNHPAEATDTLHFSIEAPTNSAVYIRNMSLKQIVDGDAFVADDVYAQSLIISTSMGFEQDGLDVAPGIIKSGEDLVVRNASTAGNIASFTRYGLEIETTAGDNNTNSVTWNGDVDTGIYRAGANDMRFSANATDILGIESTAFKAYTNLDMNDLKITNLASMNLGAGVVTTIVTAGAVADSNAAHIAATKYVDDAIAARGGTATNLTPWATEIDAAGYGLTNAGYVTSTNFVTKGQFYQSALVTITYTSTNITPDWSSGNIQQVTLTNNVRLQPGSNVKIASYTLIVKQDGTGSRTMDFDDDYLFAGGTAPTLSTGSNDIDMLGFVAADTNILYGGDLLDLD